MDKPVRLVVAAVETRPEQPETPPLLVLDSVVVADRVDIAVRRRLPPFIRDPLRPVGPRHAMPAPPPGETERWVIGQEPEGFDRFRRLEQPDRPRGFAEK